MLGGDCVFDISNCTPVSLLGVIVFGFYVNERQIIPVWTVSSSQTSCQNTGATVTSFNNHIRWRDGQEMSHSCLSAPRNRLWEYNAAYKTVFYNSINQICLFSKLLAWYKTNYSTTNSDFSYLERSTLTSLLNKSNKGV